MRKHKAFALVSAVALGLVAVAAAVFVQSRVERADCPGKIVCPRTGEIICRDKCPTIDRNRADCPGRVICPLTGKLVCKDRCPLRGSGATTDAEQSKVPSCCKKKS